MPYIVEVQRSPSIGSRSFSYVRCVLFIYECAHPEFSDRAAQGQDKCTYITLLEISDANHTVLIPVLPLELTIFKLGGVVDILVSSEHVCCIWHMAML